MTKITDIPAIRFKGFSDTWEQRKLDTVAKFSKGSGYSKGDLIETGTPIILYGRLYTKYETSISDVDTYVEAKEGSVYSKGGEVIVPASGETAEDIARAATVDKSGILLGGDLNVVMPNEDINSAFLAISISNGNSQRELAKKAQGKSVVHIHNEEIRNLIVPFPIKAEQNRIVDYFSTLDHLITLHQRKYDKLTNVKKSMLEKMFPQNGSNAPEIRFKGFTEAWEQRKLGDVVIDHNAGIYISKEDYGKGTNVIGVGNIYDSDIFDGEIYRLGPVNDDKFILEENDIIYGESSLVPEGIARTVCIGKNGAGSAFAWHTRRVKLDKNVVNSHVATLELNYLHDIRKYLVSVSTQTALTGMTTDGYFGATLTLPSIQEQQKISDYFKQLDHLITLHQCELEKLKNLKKACLEKMFV